MKAVAKLEPKPGLALVDWDRPTPGPHDVVLKVKAASICGTDRHIYNWDDWAKSRIKPPIVVGHEFCGHVVEVGREVKLLKEGDFVSAESHIPCMVCPVCRAGRPHVCANLKILGIDTQGCFADYAIIPESIAWKNAPDLDPLMASIQEPLGNAVYAALVEPVTGLSVAVIGDGPAGCFAVAVARAAGAGRIYHLCKSPHLMELAAKVGSDMRFNVDDRSVDYIAEIIKDTGVGVDVLLEMTGSQQGMTDGLRLLRKGGRFSAFGIPDEPIKIDLANGVVFKGARLLGINGRLIWETWIQMAGLLGSGALNPLPVVTHAIALEDFEKGFEAMLAPDRRAGKIVMFPDPKDVPKGMKSFLA